MNTVANQKIIHIQKKKYKNNFLQIGINEWQEAAKELSPASFKLYLYLASNADGFDLALSQVAVENAIGISKSSYHRAVAELEEKGYLNLSAGNVYFFQTSSPKNEYTKEIDFEEEVETSSKIGTKSPKNEYTESQNWDQVYSKMNREIDNIDKTNKDRQEEKEIDYAVENRRIIEELNKLGETAREDIKEKIGAFAQSLMEDFTKEEVYGDCAAEVYYILVDFNNDLWRAAIEI